jgi:hypothetical protein
MDNQTPVQDSHSKTQFTPQRWRRLQEIFERALPLGAEARAQLELGVFAGEDPTLPQAVS